ncbi:glycosyltransferase [Desulfovibrio piger]|nr:glycosyltransferase [Desulfovibrio piger]
MFFYKNDTDNEDKVILQRIILDNHYITQARSLYIFSKKKEEKSVLFSTDTYINIFHNTLWKDLTIVNNIKLNITCSGRGILYLIGHQSFDEIPSSETQQQEILASTIVESNHSQQTFCIDLNNSYNYFSLSWEYNQNDNFQIIDAYYSCPHTQEHRQIRMAIVTTTYKRQKDINTLADIYNSASHKFSEIENSTHLFIINNDFSDSSLQNIQNSNITVFNNPCNLGGAGGFTRGAQLAVASETFSHILFMDDDALVHEESWLRTLSLLSTLKNSYYNAPLSGAMFNREIPTFCQTMIEALDKNFHRTLQCGEIFLESSADVKLLLSSGHKILVRPATAHQQDILYPYAAWWYAVFPVAVFHQYGYPAPYFFRGDDQEFGIRIKKRPLFLNGICIWHPPFVRKRNALRQYLGLRNFLLTVAKHHKHWKRVMLHEVFVKLTCSLASKDYEYAAAILLAVADAFNYHKIPHEGEKLIPRVDNKTKNFKNNTFHLTNQQKSIPPSTKQKIPLCSLIVWLTMGGVLIPAKICSPFSINSLQQLSANILSQRVAYPGENTGRKLDCRMARTIWLKGILSFAKILFSRRKQFLKSVNSEAFQS